MFANRCSVDDLIPILTAESYSPDLMRYTKRFAHAPRLDDFLDDKPRLGVTGTIAKDYVDGASPGAVPYYSTKQVNGLFAYLDDCKYISPAADREWAKCRVPDGGIVINKSGAVGAAAIVSCKPYSYVNSVSDLMNIKVRKDGRGLDLGYLVVFLNSPYGQSQLIRLSGGSIFSHVSLHAVPDIRVLNPAPPAQTYIGDKVRQAERLRARARELEGEVQTFFSSQTHVADVPGTKRSYQVRTGDFSPVRLDSPFYDPAQIQLEEALRRGGGAALGNSGSLVRKKRGKSDQILYFEIGGLDIGTGIMTPTLLRGSEAPSRAQISIHTWDVLISRVRPNRKNVGLVLPQDKHLPLVASTGFSIMRFPTPEEAVFFHGWLRSDEATYQLLRWNSGGTYPAIDDEVPGDILAPGFDKEEIKEKGRRWRLKFSGLIYSERLTTAAKLLVEALIEGQVSEADFVAAQKALEANDRSADRAILQRLTRKGMDAANEPALFPDLDALYDALDALDGRDKEVEA